MHRSLPKPQNVRRLLRHSTELELSDAAITRLKWFMYCSEHYYNVSLTCRHFGISRSTFLRWAQRFEPNDVQTLEEKSRKPHSSRVAETDPRVIELIASIRKTQTTLGKVPIAEKLLKEHSIVLSSSTVGRIISRYGLFFGDSASHKAKRRHALQRMQQESSGEEAASSTSRSASQTDQSDDTGLLPLPLPTS